MNTPKKKVLPVGRQLKFPTAAEIAMPPKALARARKMVKTKAGALQLLQGAGILDANGKHTAPYR